MAGCLHHVRHRARPACPTLLHNGHLRLAHSRRKYSTPQQSTLPDIDPSKLEITKSHTPKEILRSQDLVFGRSFTDHMLSIEWTSTTGWLAPRITPYQNLSLDPATCALHYAFAAFEGMKAYKRPTPPGAAKPDIRLFRPQSNMARLNKSAARIALPCFDGAAFTRLMATFCQLDERFIPEDKGYSLYLRPIIIGTQRTLGVGPPASALLYMIASPVGPYYPTGFKAVSLEASSTAVRAWPGGVGDKKLAANYAPCILPQQQAARNGFQQNLWLFHDVRDDEDYVTEVGTMNLFAAFRHRDGSRELVTPPLDGTILEGVTRDSILQLGKERLAPEGWIVSQRPIKMREMAEAAEEGRLLEAFGAGTAAVVCPVRNISWNGRNVECGLAEGQEAGELALRLKDWVEGIQYGDEDHPWRLVFSFPLLLLDDREDEDDWASG